MHTLFVIPAYHPFIGGAQTFVRSMARRLVMEGKTATVLTTNAQSAADFWQPPHSELLLPTAIIEAVEVIRLPIRYPWPAPYRFGLWRRAGHGLQRSGLPDALQRPILSHLARSMPALGDLQWTLQAQVARADWVCVVDATWDGLFIAASQAAHRAGKPVLAVPLIHTGSAQILAHFLMAHQVEIYTKASAVGALTRSEAALITAQGIPPNRVFVLPMGVEAHKAAVNSVVSARSYGWYNEKRAAVAFVGAATFDKGAFTLVRALLALQQRGLDVDLICAGPLQSLLQHFIESQPPADQQRLRGRVHLLGVVDEAEKSTLLSAAAVLALPSRVDAFGIVILEAWSHGKPVVAAAAGGLAEIVTHGETGLLVPFDDVIALADALERLLHDPALAQRLGTAGQETVQTQYTWDHTYETLCTLYEKIHRTGQTTTDSTGDSRRRRRSQRLSSVGAPHHGRANHDG